MTMMMMMMMMTAAVGADIDRITIWIHASNAIADSHSG
jgi:hypothetical protein